MPDATDHTAAYAGRIVLVTGGAGAIGGNLTRALADLGNSWTGC